MRWTCLVRISFPFCSGGATLVDVGAVAPPNIKFSFLPQVPTRHPQKLFFCSLFLHQFPTRHLQRFTKKRKLIAHSLSLSLKYSYHSILHSFHLSFSPSLSTLHYQCLVTLVVFALLGLVGSSKIKTKMSYNLNFLNPKLLRYRMKIFCFFFVYVDFR